MENKISIWISKDIVKETGEDELDILRDLCGVEEYDEDMQEIYFVDGEMSKVEDLLAPLSFSDSFKDSVLAKCESLGIAEGGYILAQYDFVYDKKVLSDEIIFIGTFDFVEED